MNRPQPGGACVGRGGAGTSAAYDGAMGSFHQVGTRAWPVLGRAGRLARRYPPAAVLVGGLVGLGLLALAGQVGPPLADQAREVRAEAQLDQYDPLIRRHASRTGLPEPLIRTLIRAESSGRAAAVSHRGAKGLMQITPITEKDVRQRNPDLPPGDLFDPDYNLTVGTTYLAYLHERFDGDLTLTLMAYHMGPTAVRRGQSRYPRPHPGPGCCSNTAARRPGRTSKRSWTPMRAGDDRRLSSAKLTLA